MSSRRKTDRPAVVAREDGGNPNPFRQCRTPYCVRLTQMPVWCEECLARAAARSDRLRAGADPDAGGTLTRAERLGKGVVL